jgi:hypothetical protein
MRLRLSILATLLLTATGWAQQPERIDKQVVEWINTNAYPLATTDPDAAIDDLAPLEAIVGPARWSDWVRPRTARTSSGPCGTES